MENIIENEEPTKGLSKKAPQSGATSSSVFISSVVY